jgi:hypothetical protein
LLFAQVGFLSSLKYEQSGSCKLLGNWHVASSCKDMISAILPHTNWLWSYIRVSENGFLSVSPLIISCVCSKMEIVFGQHSKFWVVLQKHLQHSK